MHRPILLAVAALSLTTHAADKKKAVMTHKDKVIALLRSLETGDTAAYQYINPKKYRQHNLQARDGLEGFKAFAASLPRPQTKVKVVRAFQEGDVVFTHSEGDVWGATTFFDIFRFEDGLIVEHWDNMMPTPAAANRSGHTLTDGPTQVSAGTHAEDSKKVARALYETVFIKGRFAELPTFFEGDAYVQHNSMGADGVSGLGAMMEQMAKDGMVMRIDRIHHTLGDGDFVLITAEGAMGPKASPAPVVYYDLFRVHNGKVAEHWDVIEPTLPREKWANSNGKF